MKGTSVTVSSVTKDLSSCSGLACHSVCLWRQVNQLSRLWFPTPCSLLVQLVTQAPRGRVEEWACPVIPTLAQPWNAAGSKCDSCTLGKGGGPLSPQSMGSLFPLYQAWVFHSDPSPSLPPPSQEAVTGVWGRGGAVMNWDSWPHQCSGELEVPDAEKAHLLGSKPKVPALSVWRPWCPLAGTGSSPSLGNLPWHRPDLFSFPEQLSLLGKEGWSGFELGRESSPHAPLAKALVCASSHPYPRRRRSPNSR